jgi:AraC-like DNA-binding protein
VRIAGVGQEPVTLEHGEAVIILSGQAHALRTRQDSHTEILPFLHQANPVDEPPTIGIGGRPTNAKVLCGRLSIDWPAGPKGVSLPPFLSLRGLGKNGVRSEALQFAAAGRGATAILTRMASLKFATALRSHPQCELLFSLSASSDPIARSLQLIGSDPSAEWTIASLASSVGMGRSNFAAAFAQKVGRTPLDVITERRMQHAVHLLEQSKLKIADVSHRTGYRSQSAFSRRFTRFFGVSPGEMRRSLHRRGALAVSSFPPFAGSRA